MNTNRQYNPEMLILGREAAKLTQTGLAKLTPYTQSIISRMESAQLTMSSDNVEYFSEALDAPPSFFEQNGRIHGLGSSFLYHRKRQSMRISDLRKLEADVNIVKLHMASLLRGIDWSTDYDFVPMEVDIDGSPAEIANLTRANWQMPSGPIRNLVELVETAGGLVILYPFHVPTADGVHIWATGLPPIFVLNCNMPGDRVRWTLAHEIGHAIMHRCITKDIEQQADEFAGEFLLPRREVFEELRNLTLPKAAALKIIWKVSMQALIRRAKDIGAINDRRYKSLYVQLSKAGYRRHEPNEIVLEIPSSVHRVIEYQVQENKRTFDDVAAMMHCRRERFDAIYTRDFEKPSLRISR